jgi:NAD(P)-dependent dehydrogenase (short-subunit alcohol dehydrogenase family)
VVLADVDREALGAAEHEFRTPGSTVLAVRTDVSRAADVERLAARTVEAFGTVYVLCNNAGVGIGGLARIQRIADWEWTLGVNLWGVSTARFEHASYLAQRRPLLLCRRW